MWLISRKILAAALFLATSGIAYADLVKNKSQARANASLYGLASTPYSKDRTEESLLIAVSVSKTSDAVYKKTTLLLVGNWSGIASQPNAATEPSYNVEIEFYLSGGELKFASWYPELDCGGVGDLTHELSNGAFFYEKITEGHSRCIDGVFSVTSMRDANLFWDWGSGQATATLSRK